MIFILFVRQRVFYRSLLEQYPDIVAVESGKSAQIGEGFKFCCNLNIEIPRVSIYENKLLTDKSVSIDPSVEGASSIASKLLKKGYSSSLFLESTQYVITNQKYDDKSYDIVDASKNEFNFLTNISAKYNIYLPSNSTVSIESICHNQSENDYCLVKFTIFLTVVFFGILYLTSLSIRLCNTTTNWWILDSKGDIIYGKLPSSVDRVQFENLKEFAILVNEKKIPTAKISSIIRSSNPIRYKWFFVFPMVNNTILCGIFTEILSEDKKIDLKCEFIDYKDNITQPKISYSSPRDSKPVRISYTDKNNVNTTIYLPSDVLVPFQPFGSLATIINSTFVDIKQLLLNDQYIEKNFFKVVESLCSKLGIRYALYFDSEFNILFEYTDTNFVKLTQEQIKLLLSKVTFNSKPTFFHHIFSENDYCFTYSLGNNSFSISVAFILDHDEDNLTFIHFALPLVSSCCVYLYFLSYTKEQGLKFDRFVNLFTESKVFSLIETNHHADKLLLVKSSLIQNDIETVPQLLEILGSLSNEYVEYYYNMIRNLEKGGSFSQSMVYLQNKDRWFSVSGNCTTGNDDIITLLLEETTAIKRTERSLKETLHDLNTTYKALKMHKFTVDKTNQDLILYDNSLFAELGIEPTEGNSLLPLVHPNDKHKLVSFDTKRVTLRLFNRSNQPIWYSIVYDDTLGFIYCVNDPVEMRNKMTKNSRGLELLSSSTLIIWSVDIKTDSVIPLLQQPTIWDHLSIDRNTKFSRLLDFIHEEDRSSIATGIDSIKSGKMSQWVGEGRLNKVGKTFEWHKIIFAAATTQGEMHCLAVNIHNQKMVEIELLETQRLMDILLSSGKLMLWEFIDSQEDIPDMEEFKPGIDSRLRMSWSFVDRQIPEEHRADFKYRMEECLTSNTCFEMNMPLNFKTGQIYVSARGKLQQQTGVVQGVCIDITDLTNTLTELEEQNKKAEEANRQKTVFLANMSHEIRTPMNGIFGILDIIASQELTTEQRVMIDSVRSSSFQLMKLLDDTLNLSKIEQGDIENNPQIFNFGSILEPIFIGASSRARMNKVKFQLAIGKNFPLFGFADQQLLVQIINNLLSNALKFTKSGYIKVTLDWLIENKVNDEFNETCVIEVADTGIGISAEQQRVIFERFSQADPSVMRKFGGTGLGLSLVQEIVRFLNGKITLKSAAGEGSVFHVEIPMESVYYFYVPPFTDGKKHFVMCNLQDSEVSTMMKDWLNGFNYNFISFKKVDDILQKMTENETDVVDFVFVEGQNDLSKRVLQIVGSKQNHPVFCSINEPEEPTVFQNKITKPIFPHHFIHFINTHRFGHANQTFVQKPIKAEENHTNMKVLVVEDNKANQFVMKKILQNIGVSFGIADNGRDAISRLDEDKYDLVFMDCQMPVLDGISATKEIRSNESKWYHSIPIVALTASAVEGDEMTCINAGMDAYLAKPVRIQQIQDIIKRFSIV